MPILKAETPQESAEVLHWCQVPGEEVRNQSNYGRRRRRVRTRTYVGRKRSQNGNCVWRLAAKCNGLEKKRRNNNNTKIWKLKLGREIHWITNFLSFLKKSELPPTWLWYVCRWNALLSLLAIHVTVPVAPLSEVGQEAMAWNQPIYYVLTALILG